jgi:hypothetical protein
MPRYRFALDASTLGTFEQFPSDDDAKSHASCVADEINRNCSKTHFILVFDEAGQLITRAKGIETSDEDALKGNKLPGEGKSY